MLIYFDGLLIWKFDFYYSFIFYLLFLPEELLFDVSQLSCSYQIPKGLWSFVTIVAQKIKHSIVFKIFLYRMIYHLPAKIQGFYTILIAIMNSGNTSEVFTAVNDDSTGCSLSEVGWDRALEKIDRLKV